MEETSDPDLTLRQIWQKVLKQTDTQATFLTRQQTDCYF